MVHSCGDSFGFTPNSLLKRILEKGFVTNTKAKVK